MSGQPQDTVARPPIGENLRRAQAEAGLKNHELAATLGLPERQITRWRHDRTTPSWAAVVALGEVLNREPAWFYGEHSEPKAAA
jgi:transcriptional regulator with XRE-family HTH domain